MKLLAIEREYGSGGREIGIKVAEKLGIPYYDSKELLKAADRYGISINELLDCEKNGNGNFMEDLSRAANFIKDRDTSEFYRSLSGTTEIIKRLKEEGTAVFIGRCSTEVLKYRPDIIRVFIYSSNEKKKIRNIIRTEQVSEEKAQFLLKKKDGNRKNYFRFFTNKDWRDRNNYDMELNTDMISSEECVDLLAYMMTK